MALGAKVTSVHMATHAASGQTLVNLPAADFDGCAIALANNFVPPLVQQIHVVRPHPFGVADTLTTRGQFQLWPRLVVPHR
jgi:hypothetical protein